MLNFYTGIIVPNLQNLLDQSPGDFLVFSNIILEMENKKITEVEYMYCDASKYKFRRKFIVSGVIDLKRILPYLFEGEFFVPHEVGLNHLLDMPMNEDDHYLHSFTFFEITSGGDPIFTEKELLSRFKSAHEKGWFSSFRNPMIWP